MPAKFKNLELTRWEAIALHYAIQRTLKKEVNEYIRAGQHAKRVELYALGRRDAAYAKIEAMYNLGIKVREFINNFHEEAEEL